jgi:hypothetical protein
MYTPPNISPIRLKLVLLGIEELQSGKSFHPLEKSVRLGGRSKRFKRARAVDITTPDAVGVERLHGVWWIRPAQHSGAAVGTTFGAGWPMPHSRSRRSTLP